MMIAVAGLLAVLTLGLGQAPNASSDWPAWRGPFGTGVAAPGADPPLAWSEKENVRWKAALPGRGHASPVVSGERVFVANAIPTGPALEPEPERAEGAHDNAPVTHKQVLALLALDRRDGRVLWQRDVKEALPHERAHVTASYASASPVTDGEHVFAFFGSMGLFAFTVEGAPAWQVDLGDMQVKHAHGEGSSPALHGDTLVVNWDHEGPSFLVAFDKRTGEERWRTPRDEPTSWSSPIIAELAGGPQVVVSGSNRIRGYDLASGAVVWECGGLSSNVVATPVFGGGVVYAGSSYEKQALLALRIEGAKGDLTDTPALLWQRRRSTPYVPSPLLHDGALYFMHHYQGFLARVDAASGAEPVRPLRLEGLDNVYASPVAAAGRIYVTDLEGGTLVLASGAEWRVLALNRLDDSFAASAAIAGRELFLRGERFLYCLAAP